MRIKALRSNLARACALLGPLLVTACSESSSSSADAGVIDAGSEGPEDACSEAAPCVLQLGEAQSEFIYPQGDADPFTFDVARSGQIINLVVSNDTTLSPVTYEVVLFGPDGIALENRRGVTSQVQRIEFQRAAQVAGTHRIVIRDVGNDGFDRRNAYQVQVALLDETDTNEPNDAAGSPTALTEGLIASGTIGTLGDEDWFRISVPQNQLVEIQMTVAGDSPVTLTWTLYDPTGTRPIASSTEPAGAWPVQVRAVGSPGGDYLIVVRDDDGEQADLDRVYGIRARVLTEPDAQDASAPNETTATATPLTAGQPVTGYIGANADLDYYAIEITGASPTNPQLLVTEVTMAEMAPVDLSILVLDSDGVSQVCQAREGASCQAFRSVNIIGASRNALSTAHPVFADGTYYVLVRDEQDDASNRAVSYTLTVNQQTEPDTSETFDLTERAGATLVLPTTATTGQEIEYPWVEGYISHADDQDWYRFDIPGTENPSPFSNGDWLIQLEVEMDAPTPIELEVFMFAAVGGENVYGGFGRECRQEPGQTADFCQYPDETNGIDVLTGERLSTIGAPDAECLAVVQERTNLGPHYFRFTDLDRDDFDLGTRYRFRVILTADCPDNSVCVGEFVGPNGDLCLIR